MWLWVVTDTVVVEGFIQLTLHLGCSVTVGISVWLWFVTDTVVVEGDIYVTHREFQRFVQEEGVWPRPSHTSLEEGYMPAAPGILNRGGKQVSVSSLSAPQGATSQKRRWVSLNK